jgi:hypothetical protein
MTAEAMDVSSPIATNADAAAALTAVAPDSEAGLAFSAPPVAHAVPKTDDKSLVSAQTGENTKVQGEVEKPVQVPGVGWATSTKVVPVDVPDGQLRTELQALLVGIDLASVTVGQLRGRLEERLGLVTGALASRKRLRRQVSWAVQEEVAKKAKRSTDCDRIVKALIEFQDYPESTRQMLIDSLPAATSYIGEPHPHQAQLLQIVNDALVDARRGIEDKIEVCQMGLRSAEEEHLATFARTAETEAVEASKAAGVTAAETALETPLDCVRHAEENAKQASVRLQATADEAAALRDRRRVLSDVVDGPLQTLLDGTWTDESAREASLGVLQEHLGELGAESAMLDAVAVALVRQPQERGVFDNVTADEVKRLLVERVEELTARVVETESKQVSIEAEALATASLLGVARERSEASSKTLEKAREEHAVAVLDVKAAVVRAASSTRMVDLCISEKDLYDGRRQELNETIAIVQRLIAGSPKLSLDDGSAAIDDATSTTGASSDALNVNMPRDAAVPSPAALIPIETNEVVGAPHMEVGSSSPMEEDSSPLKRAQVLTGPKVEIGLCQVEGDLTKVEIDAAVPESPSRKNMIPATEKMGSPRPPPTPQRTSVGGRVCVSPAGVLRSEQSTMPASHYLLF